MSLKLYINSIYKNLKLAYRAKNEKVILILFQKINSSVKKIYKLKQYGGEVPKNFQKLPVKEILDYKDKESKIVDQINEIPKKYRKTFHELLHNSTNIIKNIEKLRKENKFYKESTESLLKIIRTSIPKIKHVNNKINTIYASLND